MKTYHATDPVKLFWGKVQIGSDHECWPWTGSTNEHGYGAFHNKLYSTRAAHRIAWQLFNKATIPGGMDCCHRCDNPPCCNPGHLFIGTHKENMLDAVAKGRTKKGVHGERHGRSKLSEVHVREILASRGVSKKALARKFGVSRETIEDITRRRSWRHITDIVQAVRP